MRVPLHFEHQEMERSRCGLLGMWICMSEFHALVSYESTHLRSRVANSLLSLILKTHKVNDALLLSTILSTDLRSLRRRGYNGEI
jgi:hypothetical protein